MPRKRQNEESILQRIRRLESQAVGGPGGFLVLGVGDDAALFRAKSGYQSILTCDWFLEGTHFVRHKHPADAVGWKCLARAVSDVAAMGGTPRCFLLSLALPEAQTGRWLDHFWGGLLRAAREFKCALAGGDTTRYRKILINIAVVGEVRTGRALLRSGARPGDIIYVSGCLGQAELGLRQLRSGKIASRGKGSPLKKHLYPEPRLTLGQWLAEKRLAAAMMDLSDGLSSDLPRLCAASGVGACLERAKIPLVQVPDSNHVSELDPFQLALHGGDDYELLFTVSPRKARTLPKAFRGVILTPIGKITERKELLIVEENGGERKLLPGGWDPFRKIR